MKGCTCILKYHLYIALIGKRALLPKLAPVENNGACIRRFKAADKAKKRAFSAAGGADNAEYLAIFKLKAHVVKSIGFNIITLIAPAEIFNAQYVFHAQTSDRTK